MVVTLRHDMAGVQRNGWPHAKHGKSLMASHRRSFMALADQHIDSVPGIATRTAGPVLCIEGIRQLLILIGNLGQAAHGFFATPALSVFVLALLVV